MDRRRTFLAMVMGGGMGLGWLWSVLPVMAAGPMDPLPREDLVRIAQVIPTRAPALPQRPRRLLIFTRNVNYGGHRSMAHAAAAFRLMGEATGAYATTVSDDPEIFRPESLRQFHAVFLNNNVGNLFTDAVLRASLLDFVVGGGGLLGVHGATVAFTRWPGAEEDWPEFGRMIGGRGANHRNSDERVFVRLDDPDHPVNAIWGGQPFEFRDEFFRVHEPYSRTRVRVLLSMDATRLDPTGGEPRGACVRADNDYAVAWLRSYGRGRTFYCTIAHNPYVFWDRRMLEFYLAAVQFALGDLPGPTTPSAFLTPAVRAQERLDWRVGLDLDAAAPGSPFREAMQRASGLAVRYLSVSDRTILGQDLPETLQPGLTADALSRIRLQLDDAALRPVTYRVTRPPLDEAGWRRVGHLARSLGIECLAVDTAVPMEQLEPLCKEYDLRLALRAFDRASLDAALERCRGRDPRIGVELDFTAAGEARRRLDPRQALDRAGRRLALVRVSGIGAADRDWLRALRDVDLAPTLLALTKCDATSVEALNAICLQLAP